MSVGLGGEDEGVPSADLKRRAVADTAPPSWRLEGHVRDQGGRPIAGVEILCQGLPADAFVTNEEGFYRFDLTDWPASSAVSFVGFYLSLRAWAPGFKPINNHRVKLPKQMPDAELVLVEDLVLEAGGTVYGTVLAKNGQPVRSVAVELRQDGAKIVHAYTADDGSFRVPIPKDGRFELFAANGKHGVASTALSLRANRDHQEDLRLVHKSMLRGQFVYPDGQPVANLRVGAYPPGRAHGDDSMSGAGDGVDVTGPDGRFALEGLVAGEYRLFLSQVLDKAFREKQLTQYVATGQQEHRMVLPLHRFIVEVTDKHGDAVHGGIIHLRGWQSEDGVYVRRLAQGTPLPDDIKSVDSMGGTQKRNHFVAPGTWWVISMRRGNDHAWRIAEAPRERNETAVQLQFTNADLTSRVELTVTASDHSQFSGLNVNLDSVVPGIGYWKRTDDGSGFVSMDARPGTYHLSVQAIPWESYLLHEDVIRLVAGERKEIEVILPRGCHVEWTVRAPGLKDNELMRNFEVNFEGPETTTMTHFVQDNGETSPPGVPRHGKAFTHFSPLRPGRYEVTVRLPGYQPFRTSVVLSSGETSPIEVFLER